MKTIETENKKQYKEKDPVTRDEGRAKANTREEKKENIKNASTMQSGEALSNIKLNAPSRGRMGGHLARLLELEEVKDP